MATLKRLLMFVTASVLLLLGAGAWWVYFHYSDPETVRQLIVHLAAQTCPKAKVSVASADANPWHGVSLRRCALKIGDREDAFFDAESLTLAPNASKLLEGKLQVRSINLVAPKIHLHRDAEGKWNFQELLTGRIIRFPYPADIKIRRGELHLQADGQDLPPVRFENVSGTVRLRPPSQLEWDLQAENSVVTSFVSKGRVDLAEKSFEMLAETTSGVDLASLMEELPAPTRERFGEVTGVTGKVDVAINADGRLAEGKWIWSYDARGHMHRAGLAHPRLPYPIRDMDADFVAKRGGVSVSDLHFALGPARGNLHVFIPEWQMERVRAEGTVRGLELTPAVRRILDDRLKRTWDSFEPVGFVDFEGKVFRVGGDLALSGKAHLRDGAFRFEKVPYPVENVTGVAELKDDGTLVYELKGASRGAGFEIVGDVGTGPSPKPFSLLVKGSRVPIDETLLRALPLGAAQVIRDIKPEEGGGGFLAKVSRAAGSDHVDYDVDAHVRSNGCCWQGFPYPVSNVSGRLRIQPSRVEIHDFQGTHGESTVTLSGTVVQTSEGSHVEMGIQGSRVPLDEQLRSAIPTKFHRGFDSLQPEGLVDVACNVVKGPKQEVDLELDINPAEAAITPKSFPYRFDKFEGAVRFKDGIVEWAPMTFRHGKVQFQCSGQCQADEQGGTLEIRNLTCQGLPYDEDMKRAAPPSLRRALDFLNPRQAVDAHFHRVQLDWALEQKPDWRIEMEGGITLKENEMLGQIGLRNVSGLVWYKGVCDNDHPKFEGNLELATASMKGFELTNIKSHFTIDGTDVSLANVRGNAYGGQVHAIIRLDAGDEPAYECRTIVYGARLRDYLQSRNAHAMPTGKPSANADGLVYADVYLDGKGESLDRTVGRGRLDVFDADIDRLPILQDLFRISNLREPCGKAFEEVNCNFRIEDQTVYIEDLDLLGPKEIIGPSFNLFSDGEGTLDCESLELNLMMSARWGRGRFRIPVLTPSFNLANDQVFSYSIRGTLDDPQISPAPLTGFLKMLGDGERSESSSNR